MDLPFNCELALYKKYSYRLAVHEHSWEVFPVHHDSEHCIIAPVGVKWLVRGSGPPGGKSGNFPKDQEHPDKTDQD